MYVKSPGVTVYPITWVGPWEKGHYVAARDFAQLAIEVKV